MPVLIVEDEPSIRELLCEALEQEGIRAVSASDGEQAVQIALEHRPALVVLDMGLPLLDGAAVAEKIRDAYGDVPFVIVTASRRIDAAASELRAVSYIAKPFEIADLIKVVRFALEPPPGPVTNEAPASAPG
jgi:DNA-binding response OmpR family regulator